MKFSIDGQFITNTSREMLTYSKNPKNAVNLLMSSLQGPMLSNDERFLLALKILNKDASIAGIYTGSSDDEYGVEPSIHDLPDITTENVLFKEFEKIKNERDAAIAEKEKAMNRLLYIFENASTYDMYRLKKEYREEYDEPLFFEEEIPEPISEYLENTQHEDNYGWLEPNGEFHPVPWCEHQDWADNYLKEHYPRYDNEDNVIEKNTVLYTLIGKDGNINNIVCGDVLIYKLGWILLHNTCQGIANYVTDPKRNMTKAQREFLYQYYIDRHENEKANELYTDD